MTRCPYCTSADVLSTADQNGARLSCVCRNCTVGWLESAAGVDFRLSAPIEEQPMYCTAIFGDSRPREAVAA